MCIRDSDRSPRWREARRPGSGLRERERPIVPCPTASCGWRLDLRECPRGRVAQHGIVALHEALDGRDEVAASRVACRKERVSPQPARIVARDIEAIELGYELISVSFEPVPERYR